MSFIWPTMLVWLLLLPLSAILYFRMQKQRRQRAEDHGSLGLFQGAVRSRLGRRRHVPPAFFLLGLALLLLALARPQAVVGLPRSEGTVILAFDVSGSMAADDWEPTRLEAAKVAAREFVAQQPRSVRIGVVAFSDSGLSVQSPTNDTEAILNAIDRITPQLGTSLANGIYASLNTLAAEDEPGSRRYSDLQEVPTPTPTPVPQGTVGPAVILLLTDGENTVNPNPLEAAQAAIDRGVRIYTVGIGSSEGTMLEVEGFIVHTQLDEAMLQQISDLTGGTYYNAESEQDLHAIYKELDPQLVVRPEKTEITSAFAGASILALLVGGAFSLFWFGRVP
jgi:Ca-activated chloride channel family protein